MEEEEMGGSDKSNRGGGGGEKEDQTAAAAVVKEEEEVVALPGFRFHPTDEELVGFYLRREVDKKPISIEIIKRIDIYKYDPWDLPKVSTAGEKEWYFYCLRERKYRNSIRPNRVTGSGFWKATGIDRPIHSPATGECIGLKKSLVYYRGSAGKGTKTDWMMHEFRLPSSSANNDNTSPSMQEAEIWTICRIFKRDFNYKKYAQICSRGSSSKQIPTDSNSKSSSFESDGGGAYKCFGSTSTVHQGDRLTTSYVEGPSKAFADQWNPTAQAPITTLHPEISDPIANEFYEDGNWDELGRITEHMMDPAIVYEFRYS